MRRLPLDDIEWVHKHLDIKINSEIHLLSNYKFHQITIKLTGLNKITLSDNFENLIILEDCYSGEFFKIDDVSNIKEYFTNKLSNIIGNYLKDSHTLTVDIPYNFGLFEFDKTPLYKKLISNFLEECCNCNTNTLSNSGMSNLYYFICHGRDFDFSIVKTYIDKNILSDDYFSNNMLINYCKDNHDIYKWMHKNKYLVKLKFILYSINVFSGKYNIKYDKFNDNKTKDTFDIIEVEVGMSSNYDKDVVFIRTHTHIINLILKLIISTDKKAKKYTNYLQLFDLTIKRDCVLVAKFKFKDELENLLKEETNYG